jgi:hypothetical protein
MKILIYVARFRGSYGIGLTPKDAERTMLEVAHSMPEVYRDPGSEADGIKAGLYPDPKDRNECVDFASESVETYDKREKFLAEYRAAIGFGTRMAQMPAGVSHVSVDDMGSLCWDFPSGEGSATTPPVVWLKYDAEQGKWIA